MKSAMIFNVFKLFIFCLSLLFVHGCNSGSPLSNVKVVDNSFLITANTGNKLLVTPYGKDMLRLQLAREGEAFYPNEYYEMVQDHNWSRNFKLSYKNEFIVIENENLKLEVHGSSLVSSFYLSGSNTPVLAEKQAANWNDSEIKVEFVVDKSERFTGLGHGYYARAKSLDLSGQVVERNYGSKPIEQAPLLVPFYMSNKGYGVFLNSTFPNRFSLAANEEYSMQIDDLGYSGRMDYFFIAGPKLTKVLNNYTQLTGRPRLPQKAMFGLQLSDKGHDHNSDTPSDLNWWKQKIIEHREAGYPLDHVVNDNRWRAAGGKRCESKIAWDPVRYPDPADYQKWLEKMGLVITLDFNRCIAQYSEGWQAKFNVPKTGEIEFPNSAPDLTNVEFRDWFWQVFNDQALRPELFYPGDALWIDEFDEQGHAPKDMVLANGRSSGEMRNYWFFLIAKALVEQGWDKSNINKRPFVWVRGMTAGAQRYATLWSGDIYPNYEDMAGQIRGMQLAGLAGFPYWGHDAGGFFDWNKGLGPDEALYQQWALAYGSFAPIWKPHGMGQSRWPLDRSEGSQQTATKFSKLRYQLMPYLYSAAHQAANSGIPITRPMLLEFQNDDRAWQFDLQYMWGPSMLVAPVTRLSGAQKVWLPDHLWYEYFSAQQIQGNQIISVSPELGELPIYVKAGAIIPQRKFALSTAFIDKSSLILTVYAGADGEYRLVEDDDVTERYRDADEKMLTYIRYHNSSQSLFISSGKGSYKNAPKSRDLTIEFIGINKANKIVVNEAEYKFERTASGIKLQLKDIAINTDLKIRIK